MDPTLPRSTHVGERLASAILLNLCFWGRGFSLHPIKISLPPLPIATCFLATWICSLISHMGYRGRKLHGLLSLSCRLIFRGLDSKGLVCIEPFALGAVLNLTAFWNHACMIQKFLHLWAMAAKGELKGGRSCSYYGIQNLEYFLLNCLNKLFGPHLAECLCHIISISQQQLKLQFLLWGDFPVMCYGSLAKPELKRMKL